MKVFISADIEGVTGVTTWEETEYGKRGYEEACKQMTAEVNAACEAAVESGYQVVVKDGHDHALNINIEELPRGVEVIRGWRTSPAAMMGGLDKTFDAVIYIGYHSPGGSNTNPLAHTISHDNFNWMKVNGQLASEFTMNKLWAAEYGVPSIFLSGDLGMCESAEGEVTTIVTVATKECIGNSTWNIHPKDAVDKIKEGVKEALKKKMEKPKLEENYTIEICFKEHQEARNASWYPGAKIVDEYTVAYTAKSPKELMTVRMFMTGI